MPYAFNGNAHIYYEVEGEGPPLILQHGFVQDIQGWRELGWVEALRDDYRHLPRPYYHARVQSTPAR